MGVICNFQGPRTIRRRPLEAASGCEMEGDAESFARARLQFEPDERQAWVLRARRHRLVLNCSRQWGKSTVTAIRAVYEAQAYAGSLTLIAAPTERQSGELVRKAGDMMVRLGWKARGDGQNATSLLFPNGSRIVGLPGTEATVRGFSAASLVVIDEAARVPDALYKSLRPILAVGGGDLWLLSTPYGKRGFFYEKWAYGGDRWERMAVPAAECSRIPKEYLEEERTELGPVWFRQEYMCEFVENGSGVFGRDVVEAALTDELTNLF